MTTKHLLVSLLLVLFATNVACLFEREKGLYDWRIENVGQLKDLKYLENTSLVYTLSEENVLTLFDIAQNQIVWKKELPVRENFKLRYLSRNLLVYSDDRALLINSASHVIYDVQFDAYMDPAFTVSQEDTGLAVEFFELKGHVYSVFAKNYKVITYKDYQQVGVQEYSNYTQQMFKPLGLIFDRPSQELILLAQIDEDNLRSFTVDVITQEMIQRDTVFMPKDISYATRTANYFALKQADQVMFYQATDLMQQVFVGAAVNVDFSVLDDVILILPHETVKPRFFNVAINKEEKMNAVTPGTCYINRAHESENIDGKKTAAKDFVYYTVQCKLFLGLFSLRTADNDIQVVFKTMEGFGLGSQPHGLMRRSFKSEANLIVQLGDLSLHNIEIATIKKLWSREESLSKIKQVEVIEQSAVRIESELEYVKNVRNPDKEASIPTRIANRYKENLAFLLRHLQDLSQSFAGVEGSASKKDSANGLFGFKKVFLMLTDVGRLVALTSTDGHIQWSEYMGATASKIVVRNMLDSDINENGALTQTKQIGVILHDEIKFLNPQTGKSQSSYDLSELPAGVHRDFILISLSKSGAQFILGIQDDLLEAGKPLTAYPTEQFSEDLMVGESVYFTHVDKTRGLISGYKLGKDLVAAKAWSFNCDRQGERILRLETQFQTASSVDHLHFTPTAFSGENIIYKHLDSNVFTLATALKGDNAQNELIVYLINGISGKILHRYQEKRVRLDLIVDFVLSEHLFILAFQRQEAATGLSHQEITVTELYSQRQEANTKNLLMEYYSKGEDRLLQKHFSSFLVDQPVIVQESYVLPFNIKALALTQTLHHITGKNLVVLTANNQVYQIDNNLFSARRPHAPDNTLLGGTAAPVVEDPKKEQSLITSADLKNKELPPYDAVIPVISTRYLSYGLNLLHLREIKAFPTRLESTSQVLTYGFDVFFMRISPENTFDMLQEYFNYTLLFLFIGGLALTTLVIRNYVQKQKRQTNFMLL